MAVKKQFNSFEEMIEGSELPLLVDFYAPWCGPCQMMAKILDQVGAQMREQVQIVKLNTDNYGEIASQFKPCQRWCYLKMGNRSIESKGLCRLSSWFSISAD
jgi:thiol-disulfide isomerase/thioredoxin